MSNENKTSHKIFLWKKPERQTRIVPHYTAAVAGAAADQTALPGSRATQNIHWQTVC